jgi:hypothetical protein
MIQQGASGREKRGPATAKQRKAGLDLSYKGAFGGDETVGHARGVESEAGIAVAVEEDEAAGGVGAFGKKMDGFAGGEIGAGGPARDVARRVHASGGAAEKINGGFGQDHFHDGFAVAGAGDAAGFGVGVATTADQGRIADAAGKFTASAAGGGGGEETAIRVECDGTDSSLFVAAVMLGSVFVGFAFHPSFVLGFADQFFALAKLDSVFDSEAFGAFGNQHHVRAILKDLAGNLNGVFDALQGGGSAGAKRGAVHHDGVALDMAVEIEVRAVTGIEDGIVFEDDDRGFYGIKSSAATGQDGPTGGEGAVTARFASIDGFVGNVPGATVNNKGRLHDQRIAEKTENRNWKNQLGCEEFV